jgi:hypothetical protein
MQIEFMCPILGLAFFAVCTLATDILVVGRRKN